MNRRYTLLICCLVFCLSVTTALTACAFAANSTVDSSSHETFTIEQQAGVTDQSVNEIQQAADATKQFFADSMGLALEKPVTLVLTPDRPSYIAEVITRFKISELDAERAAKGTDALAGKDLIIINVSGIPTVRQKTFLIAHELTHKYQYQLAGPQASKVMWLLEGMAESIGAQVVARQGYWKLDQYYNNWQSGLRLTANKPTLGELETRDGWSLSISQYGSPYTYKTAGLAVLVLTERFGQQQVLDYFTRLGRGETPETAFQNAFGTTMSDFANDFTRSIRKAS
ncbi:MAG TPA: hypothetical protein VGL27_11045 [Negativicutes bacterium]